MKLSEFNPNLDPSLLDDTDVVGVLDGLVVHFKSDDGTIYNAGQTLDEFITDLGNSWTMNENEAARCGLMDYAAYLKRRGVEPDDEA